MDEERRLETRIRSKGTVHLLVQDGPAICGDIYDVSPDGMSVDAEAQISIGTRVHIDAAGYIADGVIRYCDRSEGGYRIGVALELAG